MKHEVKGKTFTYCTAAVVLVSLDDSISSLIGQGGRYNIKSHDAAHYIVDLYRVDE